MKKIQYSWSIHFNWYPGRDNPVTKYLNHYYKETAIWHSNGDGKGKYWGVTFVQGGKKDICICSSGSFGRVITEQEFLNLTMEMTNEEIEKYKDFKKGDVLVNITGFCKVIETAGDIVFRSPISTKLHNLTEALNVHNTSTKKEIYDNGWRLYVPKEQETTVTVLLTLEDIAKKYGVKPEQLKIKY